MLQSDLLAQHRKSFSRRNNNDTSKLWSAFNNPNNKFEENKTPMVEEKGFCFVCYTFFNILNLFDRTCWFYQKHSWKEISRYKYNFCLGNFFSFILRYGNASKTFLKGHILFEGMIVSCQQKNKTEIDKLPSLTLFGMFCQNTFQRHFMPVKKTSLCFFFVELHVAKKKHIFSSIEKIIENIGPHFLQKCFCFVRVFLV